MSRVSVNRGLVADDTVWPDKICWLKNSPAIVALVPTCSGSVTVGAFSFDEPVWKEPLVSYTVRKCESSTVNEALAFDLSIEFLDEFFVDRAFGPRVVVKSNVERL